MKIYIGCDHGGLDLKNIIVKYLQEKGNEIVDVGTYTYDSCDYPVYAKKVAKAVANNECDKGIVICSTGIGVSIVANKVKGVRCGIGYNDDVARLIRQHNDCNMVSFGASFMSIEDILRRVDIFLNTDFEGGRHCLRVNTFVDYENNN